MGLLSKAGLLSRTYGTCKAMYSVIVIDTDECQVQATKLGILQTSIHSFERVLSHYKNLLILAKGA